MKFSTQDSRRFFYLLLLIAGISAYFLLQNYLATCIFALVVAMMFKPLFDNLMSWLGGRQIFSTILTMSAIFLTILVPLLVIYNVSASQASDIQASVKDLLTGKNVSITQVVDWANAFLVNIPFVDNNKLTEAQLIEWIRGIIEPVVSYLGNAALNIGSSSAGLVTKFVVFVAIIVVLLPRYHQFIQMIKDLSPLDDDLDQKYIDRITAMTKSMVKGIFLIAVVQGLVTGGLFFATGVKYASFLTMLAIFMALIPMGSQVLSVIVGLTMLALGNTIGGWVIIGGSLLIVSQIDNFLRPMLVPRESEMNIALFLLSAFGGLNLFGFLGIIYGPVVMIFVVTTIDIYLEYYRHEADQHSGRQQSRYTRRRPNTRGKGSPKTSSSKSSSRSGQSGSSQSSSAADSGGDSEKKSSSSGGRGRSGGQRRRPSGNRRRRGSGSGGSKPSGGDEQSSPDKSE